MPMSNDISACLLWLVIFFQRYSIKASLLKLLVFFQSQPYRLYASSDEAEFCFEASHISVITATYKAIHLPHSALTCVLQVAHLLLPIAGKKVNNSDLV